MDLTPWPGATKAVLVKTDDEYLIQWRVGERRVGVTRLRDADLADELGGGSRDADSVACVERRLHSAGFIAKRRGGQPHLHGRREVAVWQLRQRLR